MIFKWGYAMSPKVWNKIPEFALNMPNKATTVDHLKMTFYCINCHQKAVTRYITPNFGPFCADCLDTCLSELLQQERG